MQPYPLLQTKLYIPPIRPELVPRPRLIERLNAGLHRKLTLISAPAGFGKTTLVSEWLTGCERLEPKVRAAWLSLDEEDNDPTRFLIYLVAALQTITASTGEGVLGVLHASQPQPPPTESILTSLINEISAIPDDFILVLDDYHLIDAQPVDASTSVDMALTFLLGHLPPQMHLVIVSRIDPALPLSRLRAGGQMTEIREADLRFSADESNKFLGKVMGLNLSAENVAALEARIEGWIAGLQLAALSMRGLQEGSDIADFIDRFTSSDRYIHDYLTDEVLRQRPKGTRDFLTQTSILDRLSGPLCDAVTKRQDSQAILEALEAANLFIVPLDNERCWYRYHALFCDLLRQRLYQSTASSTGDEGQGVAEYHIRASEWYENNGLEIDAFHHAAAANDIERAARLMEGDWMPLPFRGAVLPVLNWLKSLPTTVLDARPLLWVTYASTLLGAGQRTGVEQKLQAAETALAASAALGVELDDKTRDLVGRIAAVRATLAISQHQVETIIAQSHRALEYLHPDNLAFRTSTTWKLGYAYHLQGDHAAASRAYTEAMSIGLASGNILFTVSAMLGLGSLQETANQLYLAAESYRRALHLFGDQPLPALACEAHLGLARIFYEWNDLDAAQQHRQQSVQLVRQTEGNDTFAACEVFLARLKLAEGDVDGAAAVLARADQFVRQHNLVNRMPEVAAAQVRTMLWQGPQLQQKPLLHQGNLAAAADLAETHELPISQARVHLAQGDTSAALAALGPLCQQMEAKGLANERLKVMVLQAVAHYAHGEKEVAVQLLGDTLAPAEPGGFIRLFVDEGMPMARLLSEAAAHGIMPDYVGKLLAAFEAEEHKSATFPPSQPLVEPLSPRELEVLGLIAQGLSNREIGERLFLALSTVKGHNRRIYGKLHVRRRTEAVVRARELGLL